VKIETLKDLEKLIKLCRKTGVSAITVDGIELSLSAQEKPTRTKSNKVVPGTLLEDTFDPGQIETPDQLTEEQLMMWSVGGEAPIVGN
jgi:hypothetical protein